MVGHRVGQREPDEATEAQAVQEGFLEARIGQPVPLLQQEALEQEHRPVGRPPDRRRVDLAQEALERRPVDQRRDPLQLPVAPHAALDQPVRQTQLPQLPPHPHLPRPLRSHRITNQRLCKALP
jgi:hypothetical protein